mgnify:CR=1 FL=1
MNFIASNTPDKEEYTHGRTITQEYIQEYLAQPVIQCPATRRRSGNDFAATLSRLVPAASV